MIKRAPIAPHNLALLACIRQHQPVCTWDAFSVFAGAGESVRAFSVRLVYLRRAGWLANVGSNYRGIWSLTEKAVALLERGGCPEPAPNVPVDDDEPDLVVPPRRTYVMQGDPYQPPPPMPCRDGAMDFANCPSIEAGRARPFIPGKVNHG